MKFPQKYPVVISLIVSLVLVVAVCILAHQHVQKTGGLTTLTYFVLPIYMGLTFFLSFTSAWSVINFSAAVVSIYRKKNSPAKWAVVTSVFCISLYLCIAIYLYLPTYHGRGYEYFSTGGETLNDSHYLLTFRGRLAGVDKSQDICYLVVPKAPDGKNYSSYINVKPRLTVTGKIEVTIHREGGPIAYEPVYLPFKESIYIFSDGVLKQHHGTLSDFKADEPYRRP